MGAEAIGRPVSLRMNASPKTTTTLRLSVASTESGPCVVVLAHRRPDSLRRLLGSLQLLNSAQGTPLVISVDGNGADEVHSIAEAFEWPFGEKEVLRHESQMGLREHVLSCGDLTEEYGDVIMLEDDLVVSPQMLVFARQCVDAYRGDTRVAGVSLYSPQFSEPAQLPFMPMLDGNSVFFAQVPSSWGQVWTRSQWHQFREWYSEHAAHSDLERIDSLPPIYKSWPQSSWKKYFAGYLAAEEKYFVYPRHSLSTNCGDAGVHLSGGTGLFQVPLVYASSPYTFGGIEESLAVYDAFWEPLADRLKRLCPVLSGAEFEVDLYGKKPYHNLKQAHTLTTRGCSTAMQTFGRLLQPVEMNLALVVPGAEIALARTSDCAKQPLTDQLDDVLYHCSYAALLADRLQEADDIRKSLSWRITEPLRWILKKAQG